MAISMKHEKSKRKKNNFIFTVRQLYNLTHNIVHKKNKMEKKFRHIISRVKSNYKFCSAKFSVFPLSLCSCQKYKGTYFYIHTFDTYLYTEYFPHNKNITHHLHGIVYVYISKGSGWLWIYCIFR